MKDPAISVPILWDYGRMKLGGDSDPKSTKQPNGAYKTGHGFPPAAPPLGNSPGGTLLAVTTEMPQRYLTRVRCPFWQNKKGLRFELRALR